MIEVGEYIRTIRGIIGKIIRVEFDEIDKSLKWYVFLGKDEFGIEKEIYINKPYIKNHSKKPIDLIEAGDYVNGHKVYEIVKDTLFSYVVFEGVGNYIDTLKEIPEEDIKTILTKELFEANCYKVKEG